MKRSAASAGQLSDASMASASSDAVHSLSHRTLGVDVLVEARNRGPLAPRAPHSLASVIHGAALTRALVTRYVESERSTVITERHTAFAGSGVTTTSSSSTARLAARADRAAASRATREPAVMISVTTIQPATANVARAPGRSTRASTIEAAAPMLSSVAAPSETRLTRHASTKPISSVSERRTRAILLVLDATSIGTAIAQNHGSTMKTASP